MEHFGRIDLEAQHTVLLTDFKAVGALVKTLHRIGVFHCAKATGAAQIPIHANRQIPIMRKRFITDISFPAAIPNRSSLPCPG